MPQMKPLHWTWMLISVTYLLLILLSLIYYSFYPYINQFNYKMNKSFSHKSKWNWKW